MEPGELTYSSLGRATPRPEETPTWPSTTVQPALLRQSGCASNWQVLPPHAPLRNISISTRSCKAQIGMRRDSPRAILRGGRQRRALPDSAGGATATLWPSPSHLTFGRSQDFYMSHGGGEGHVGLKPHHAGGRCLGIKLCTYEAGVTCEVTGGRCKYQLQHGVFLVQSLAQILVSIW